MHKVVILWLWLLLLLSMESYWVEWWVQAEKAAARTEEEKVLAHERAKAKEAKAKMELHEAKARHAAEKISTKQPYHFGHKEPPLVGAQQQGLNLNHPPVSGSYPLGGNYPMNKHI